MKRKIIFRADGNSKIGLGHIYRCLALAGMINDNFDCVFAINQPSSSSILKQIKKVCSDVIILDNINPAENNNDEQLFDLENYLVGNNIVVVDGYRFQTNYQLSVKRTGATLICIDDLAEIEFYADVIINHAPGINALQYRAQKYTQFALGTEYVLLRGLFLQQAKKNRLVKSIKNVIVCFGGSDYKNLSEKTLTILKDFTEFKKIIIVTGAAYTDFNNLTECIKIDTRINHFHDINEKKMLSLMLDSDLAIVPASGILLETLTAGCKIVSGFYTENQKNIYAEYKKINAFIDAKNFSYSALRKAIKKSLTSKHLQPKVFDGQSAERLKRLFLNLKQKEHLNLKTASISDLEVTYHWAKNPLIRVYSFQKNIITKSEHTAWFTNRLADKNCLYLLAEVDKQLIGSIRFDIKENQGLISYLIDPLFQGKGLGQILLIAGIEYLEKWLMNKATIIDSVIGFVIKTNIPSVKAFERTGFIKYDEGDKFKFLKQL